ncbi:hypothetical protein HBI24_240210 [Parastagonospora nodorum]|nr:hypothetical protein HBH49_225000 [Parastagonospora nodorum]KAH5238531.1 hypothetical protein HBI71_230930 [Parastagonospora nodorum]KAH5241651.1 hypothetical protein HBI72_202050 [Parastagonospora nodorum]KAH5349807.1 hypothetical protein HBI33_220080 [Parastagonospora nodorum]KAH5469085.1 hypothetical protein HBI31_196560 [Parastagonospora nodorum]
MSGTKAQRTNEEKGINAARELSMKKFEDRYAEPPAYSSRPPSSNEAPSRTVPNAEELNFQPSPLEIPTPAECIAHLKLLHAFAKLRHEVGNHEGLFGISMGDTGAKRQTGGHSGSNGPNQSGVAHEQDAAAAGIDTHTSDTDASSIAGLAERIRGKRWAVFVTKAVARFEKWWELMQGRCNWYRPIRTDDFEGEDVTHAVRRFPTTGDGYDNSEAFFLPPLDVLMVWHAYMLNPRIYLEDSVRYTKPTLWRTAFPWARIYQIIDKETFEYSPGTESVFEQATRLRWNSLQDERLATIKCPQCRTTCNLPWTRPPTESVPETLEIYLANDTGFAGSEFDHRCSTCSLVITHEKLRVGKFCDDTDSLIQNKRPLSGTILNAWGEPSGTTTGKKLGTHDAFFPHRVIETKTEFRGPWIRPRMSKMTMELLKLNFQNLMRTQSDVLLVNAQQKKPYFIAKASRIAVRKVLSHYWDNSSVFGIDLVGAVLRQGVFVQKMTKLDWLHSPTLMSTTQRLIVKYHRFVRLAAENPQKIVVPTLDVDLAWHTHQLTPKSYYAYTMAETKKFLNHDDKIPESNLHNSFQFTSLAYEKKYAQPYSECCCWYCECTREPLRSSFLSKLSSRRTSLSIPTLTNEKGFTTNPHEGVHLSSHNALPMPRSAEQKRKELEDLDLQYAKVLKRYQKQKAAEPKRDGNDAYVYGAYGYPMYYPMPIYVPYYADPSAGEHASADVAGTVGCAAGTCGAGTSIGACAGGLGTPGCAASCGGHGGADGGCGSCGGGDGGGGGGGGCGGGD